MAVTLTAAGKPPTITDQFSLINEWHRLMGKMLTYAASLHDEHQRNEQMRTWVETHDELHDRYATRYAQWHREHQAYLVKCETLATMSDRVNNVQRRLTDESIATIEQELHFQINDHIGQFLAITARETGISDLSTVLDCFMRDNTTINVNREEVPF